MMNGLSEYISMCVFLKETKQNNDKRSKHYYKHYKHL